MFRDPFDETNVATANLERDVAALRQELQRSSAEIGRRLDDLEMRLDGLESS